MALDFPSSPTTGQTYTGSDGTIWKWDGTKWVSGATGGAYAPLGAVNNVGRNVIHNPLFKIAQRGVSFSTSGVYTLDRWSLYFVGGSMSLSQLALADIDRAQIGDEAADVGLFCACTGTGGAADVSLVGEQHIEDVRRLAGKTVTLSFWARAVSGTNPKLGIDIYQGFGSGGSPSGAVALPAQAVTLSPSWVRYTTTWNMPSIAGKTFGTNPGTSFTGLQLIMSSGANNNVYAGGIGVQSYTLGLWGVQLEVGNAATPLEKPDPRYDLANCQRFYQILRLFMGAYLTTGQLYDVATTLLTSMRASPTLTPLADNSTGVGARTLGNVEGAIYVQAAANATASGTINVTVALSADL